MDSRLLWVCLGGAAGTAARYWLTGWAPQALGTAFPYGTLLVNAIGSFLLGVVMHVGLATEALHPTARIALGVGVMGGFTTYSAFSYETVRLAGRAHWSEAATYVVVTTAGCLALCLAGIAVGRQLIYRG